MRLLIETTPYDKRALTRPWAAVLDYSGNPQRPDYAWLQWIGTAGQAGQFETTVPPGSVIATGQRNMKSHRGSTSYYLIEEVGYTMTSEALTAFKHWRRFQSATPADPAPLPLDGRDLEAAALDLREKLTAWAATLTRYNEAATAAKAQQLAELADWIQDQDRNNPDDNEAEMY